jgi:hypothetical protein
VLGHHGRQRVERVGGFRERRPGAGPQFGIDRGVAGARQGTARRVRRQPSGCASSQWRGSASASASGIAPLASGPAQRRTTKPAESILRGSSRGVPKAAQCVSSTSRLKRRWIGWNSARGAACADSAASGRPSGQPKRGQRALFKAATSAATKSSASTSTNSAGAAAASPRSPTA